jgi:hypothetical protein
VETRLGMITHCNSANFNDVDGIIGFGWANQNRSAAILKTLTQDSRPHWDIKRKSFDPRPPAGTPPPTQPPHARILRVPRNMTCTQRARGVACSL